MFNKKSVIFFMLGSALLLTGCATGSSVDKFVARDNPAQFGRALSKVEISPRKGTPPLEAAVLGNAPNLTQALIDKGADI